MTTGAMLRDSLSGGLESLYEEVRRIDGRRYREHLVRYVGMLCVMEVGEGNIGMFVCIEARSYSRHCRLPAV